MNWIVLKFGGSSITKLGFDSIVKIINEILADNSDTKIIVVLSAIKNVTNLLLNKKFEEVKNISNKLMIELNFNNDLIKKINNIYNFQQDDINIIALGEIISTNIFYNYYYNLNQNVKLLNSKDFIFSKNEYANNELYLSSEYFGDIDNFNKLATEKNIFICQGFIGSTPSNKTCLIGRGGSDTSASIIGNMLNAKCVEIWTDVNGMYTADPNKVKNCKIIEKIGYDQSQELAAMGAKVLHPFCIIPCKVKKIPMIIRNTYNYDSKYYTQIGDYDINLNKIYAITDQNKITVFNIESINMWNDYGFVYDIFEKFSRYGIDVNIITTSQFTISTTTDCKNKILLNKIKNELENTYNVTMIENCSIISIVGDSIKNQNVSKAINITKDFDIHMIHHSANDLSISFVINSIDSNILLNKLHDEIICEKKEKEILNENTNIEKKWWYSKLNEINNIMTNYNSIYLYDLEFIKNQIEILKNNLPCIDQIYYSMKANNNENILKKIADQNIGFECVSFNEVKYIRNVLKLNNDIIFTPNFCNINEYINCFDQYNIKIIVDNIEIIKQNINIFKNKEIGIRVDLNNGDGHHKKVITEGNNAKFGSTLSEILENIDLFNRNNIFIVGLHSHRGSGIQNYKSWYNTGIELIKLSKHFKNIKWIDLGGGFGVDNNNPIDFTELNKKLCVLKKENNIKFFIEPGRFVVSEGGILISKVTQVKEKETINYIGIDTGMNSLIRPTLYGSYHMIHNISKLSEKETKLYNIVGPICESGDFLGNNRQLPITEVNDIILIENAGAYGHVMSTNYNMRNPAIEIGL